LSGFFVFKSFSTYTIKWINIGGREGVKIIKKIFSILVTLLFTLTLTTLVYASSADGTGPWADDYQNFVQGDRKDGGDVKAIRSNPQSAIGESESIGLDQESVYTEGQFLSLGFGGTITLKFTNSIVDGEGDDFMVYEVTGMGTYPIEKAKVEVSANGIDFVEVGEVQRDGSVDISGKASCVQYVRITDTTDVSLPFGTGDTVDGYDLDGVEAIHSNENGCVFDDDEDGISNDEDFCPNTKSDYTDFLSEYGVHRWYWNENMWNQQPNSKGKGNHEPFDDNYTYGCSCKQILDLLKGEGYGEFGGHYKFGCSTSILQDFHQYVADGDIDGLYWIERVTVPATKTTDTLSSNILQSEKDYLLRASGTADANDGITFDARYSFRIPTSLTWTDLVSTYEGYGPTLLDLLYNDTTPWGDYDASHVYDAYVVGDGSEARFRIHDIYYPNNSGNLYVDIYGKIL